MSGQHEQDTWSWPTQLGDACGYGVSHTDSYRPANREDAVETVLASGHPDLPPYLGHGQDDEEYRREVARDIARLAYPSLFMPESAPCFPTQETIEATHYVAS